MRFQWPSGVLFRKHKKIGRCGRQDILSWATTLGPVFALSLSLSRPFHRLGNVVGKVQFAFEHYLLVCLFRKALQEHACRAALASRSWSFVLIARACVGIKKVSALFTRTRSNATLYFQFHIKALAHKSMSGPILLLASHRLFQGYFWQHGTLQQCIWQLRVWFRPWRIPSPCLLPWPEALNRC